MNQRFIAGHLLAHISDFLNRITSIGSFPDVVWVRYGFSIKHVIVVETKPLRKVNWNMFV